MSFFRFFKITSILLLKVILFEHLRFYRGHNSPNSSYFISSTPTLFKISSNFFPCNFVDCCKLTRYRRKHIHHLFLMLQKPNKGAEDLLEIVNDLQNQLYKSLSTCKMIPFFLILLAILYYIWPLEF